MNYPLTNDCRICINPFSNLLLPYTERENVDRKDALTSITENAFDIIHRPKAINYFQVLFLEKALNLLIRQLISEQHFETVELLSLEMLRNADGGKDEYKRDWVSITQNF